MTDCMIKSPELLQPIFTEGFNLTKYNISTLASLSADVIPKEFVTLSSPAFTVIAYGGDVYIFKEEPSFELSWKISLDSNCESLSFSDDSSVLMIAEVSGKIQLLLLSSNTLIWSHQLEENGIGCLKKAICSELSGLLSVYVFSEPGNLFKISAIKIASENGSCSANFSDSQVEKINLSEVHPAQVFMSAFKVFHPLFPIGFLGKTKASVGSTSDYYTIEDMVDGDFASDWEWNIEDEKFYKFYDFSAFGEMSKVSCSKNGRYIICLSVKKNIFIFCAFTQQLIKDWGDEDIENFVLKNAADPENLSHSNFQIGLLRKINDSYVFEIRRFPSFDFIYKLQVPECVYLCESESNLDAWYFVDKESANDSGNNFTLNIKSLSESHPEARLWNLLKRRKFKEAELYAKMCCIDPEIIYKTKLNCMLEDHVNASTPVFSEGDVKALCKEIDLLLSKIKDAEFIKGCIMSVTNDQEIFKNFILCIKTWLSANIGIEGIQDLICEINIHENRIVTYKLLPEYIHENLSLKEFFSKDLLHLMASELISGNFAPALTIWQRHKVELLNVLSVSQISDLLNAVSGIPSRLLIQFLQDDFLPSVLSQIPDSIVVVAKWIVNKINLLELSEKDDWPNNAERLTSLFFKVIKSLVQRSGGKAISFSTTIALANIDQELTNPKSSVGCLYHLLKNLKTLSELKEKFNCKIPLATFQESKIDVVFSVLDRIDLKYVVDAICGFCKTFTLENELNLDQCLQIYIEDVLKKSCLTWWSVSEEPLEEHLCLVLSCIQDPQNWVEAALLLVSKAHVPWSEDIQNILQRGVKQEKINEFKKQHKLVGLKEILVKYELKKFPLNDLKAIDKLINYIFKQGRVSALEDAKQVTLSCFDSLDCSAYSKYLTALLHLNKLDQFFDLFLDVPSEHQVEVACRVLLVSSKLVEDYSESGQQNLAKSAARVSIYLLEFLKTSSSKYFNQNLLNGLRSMLKMMKEFSIDLNLKEVMDKTKAMKIITERMHSILDEEVEAQMIKSKDSKRTSIFTKLSSINRMCDILLLERASVMAVLITGSLHRGLYKLVIQLCGELVSSYPHHSHETLLEVVNHFYENLPAIGVISFDALITMLQHLSNMVVTHCPDGALNSCMYVAKLSNYLAVVQKITGSQSFVSPNLTADVYQKWRLSPVYVDKGFQLDVHAVMSFIQKLFCFLRNKGNLHQAVDLQMEEFYNIEFAPFIKHLNQRGQKLASLHTTLLFLHLQMNSSPDISEWLKAYEMVKHSIEGNVADLLMKMMDGRKLDMDFAVGVLNMFQREPEHILQKLEKWSSKDLRCVMSLGEVCSEFFRQCDKTSESSEYDKIYRKALLLSMQKVKTSCTDVALKSSDASKSWNVIKDVILSPNVSLSTVFECCSAFDLIPDYVLVAFMNNLLIEAEKLYSSEPKILEDSLTSILNQVKNVIDAISSEELIIKNLESILKKIGSYSYEVLLFLHHQISNVSSNVVTVNSGIFDKGIELLNFLRVYTRTSPIGEVEKHFWLTQHPIDTKMPPVSCKRLPFWPIFSNSNIYKIINPELSASNITIWLSIAPSLDLCEDDLIIIAIKNTVTEFVKKIQVKVFNSSQNRTFIMSLRDMFSRIKNLELAVSTACWVAEHMPPGIDKVYCCKMAEQVSSEWAKNNPTDREASVMHEKLLNLCQFSHIERILHQYNFAIDSAMPLAKYPVQLVEHLIEHYCDEIDSSIKVCKIAGDISQVARVDLNVIFFKFFYKWLASSSVVSNLDESTMNISDGLLEENVDANILRAINLILGISEIKHDIFNDLKLKVQDMPNILNSRLMFCLVSVYGADAFGKAMKVPPSAVRPSSLALCLCASEIESLHLAYSTETIAACDKVELVQGLLSDQPYNTKVILLCIRICLEYNIWETWIWEIFFHRLVQLSLANILENVLETAQGHLVHMWHSESFVSAWNCVLSNCFKYESSNPPEVIDKVQKTLMSCPCVTALNLESLWTDLSNFLRETTGKKLNLNSNLDLYSFIQALKHSRSLLADQK